jgi:hypothetical protein
MNVRHLVSWDLAGETAILKQICPSDNFVHLYHWSCDRTRTPKVGSRRLSTWSCYSPSWFQESFSLEIYFHSWYASYFLLSVFIRLQKLNKGRCLTCSPSGQTHKHLPCHSSESLVTSSFDTLWLSQKTSSTWVMVSSITTYPQPSLLQGTIPPLLPSHVPTKFLQCHPTHGVVLTRTLSSLYNYC